MEQDAVAAVDARHVTHRCGSQTLLPPAYASVRDWEERAAVLRDHIAAVTGLLPKPEFLPRWTSRTPTTQGSGYSVDRVALLGPSGLACTGNLYRPARPSQPAPAILNPHGHWERGRLEHSEAASVRARCITFARMGMYAFAYDMVGYNDSLQIPDHHFASRRGALWGMTSLNMQTWNSLLALEFLCGLDDVDANRIGITGASGGASQALLLAALDARIAVTAPVNMISAHFQGGCECENTPGLRVDTNNIEIAALSAPRPMLMVSATGDWTCDSPRVEYPALRQVYDLYGCPERIAHVQIDSEHNYNAASRAHVYRWFARWLGGASEEEVVERPFMVDTDERLRVFPSGVLPPEIPGSERLPAAWRTHMIVRQDALWPETRDDLHGIAALARMRIKYTLGLRTPSSGDAISYVIEPERAAAGSVGQQIVLGRPELAERIACLRLPPSGEFTGNAVLVDPVGRLAFEDELARPGTLVRSLQAMGYAIHIPEPFGMHTPPRALARHDADWSWSCFNPPLVGEQVQDILVLLEYLARQTHRVALFGSGAGALWALFACALGPADVKLCADLTAFDLELDATYLQHLSVPLARAYDLCTMAAMLVAPRPLLLGVSPGWQGLRWAAQSFDLHQARAAFYPVDGPLAEHEILTWEALRA
jgi:dienelactone hydrolase